MPVQQLYGEIRRYFFSETQLFSRPSMERINAPSEGKKFRKLCRDSRKVSRIWVSFAGRTTHFEESDPSVIIVMELRMALFCFELRDIPKLLYKHGLRDCHQCVLLLLRENDTCGDGKGMSSFLIDSRSVRSRDRSELFSLFCCHSAKFDDDLLMRARKEKASPSLSLWTMRKTRESTGALYEESRAR